jgi:16S rRNA processing protein RimM
MKRISLGKIVAAHGIKGLVKILPYIDDPTLIQTLESVFTSEQGRETLKVRMKSSAGKDVWLAEVNGIANRNDAENLRGTVLYAERQNLPEPKNGHYDSDLIGLKVYNQNNQQIGMIINVADFGAGRLLEFQPLSGNAFYVPMSETYVTMIDVAAQRINLHENYKQLNFS